MTGTIVSLSGSARTGTIRSQEGSRFVFWAAGVLGDFDTLAVGHLVSFDLDRVQSQQTAVRVFREPAHQREAGNKPGAPPDLRYAGFHQTGVVRSYCFDRAAPGGKGQGFVVTVNMTLLLRHRIGVQEVPSLCLLKLAADLRDLASSQGHEFGEADMIAYAQLRTSAAERKRARHPFVGRRGSPPPAPSDRIRV